MDIELGKQALSKQGLNMFAVLGQELYPQALVTALSSVDLKPVDYPSLVLIGHAGTDIWRQVGSRVGLDADPVDEFSKFHARRFVAEYLDDCRYQILYPGKVNIPLQQLGAAVGWHHTSPLGIGLHSVFGPWFGYRVALLVKMTLPAMIDQAGNSPCDQCEDKPCLDTCPASALSADLQPDVSACIGHRLKAGSSCQRTCLARLACPVGQEFRYSSEQLGYFYQRSLDSIRTHIGDHGGNT